MRIHVVLSGSKECKVWLDAAKIGCRVFVFRLIRGDWVRTHSRCYAHWGNHRSV